METLNVTKPSIITRQLLNLDEVKAITGLSTSTIYKYMKSGMFPLPKNCGTRAVRWRLSDVMNYVNS